MKSNKSVCGERKYSNTSRKQLSPPNSSLNKSINTKRQCGKG